MALITKENVAVVLGIANADLPQSVYDWSVTQFYFVTDLVAADTVKSKSEFFSDARQWLQLNDTNIKSISELRIDGEVREFTLNNDMFFNPQTGLVKYTGGLSGLVKVTYVQEGFTAGPIHDYLVALLCAKSIAIFSPETMGQVKSISIGKWKRTFGNVSNDLEGYKMSIDSEIRLVVGLLNGDDGRAKFGVAV